MRHGVAVVAVQDGAIHHGAAEVHRVACGAEQAHIDRLNHAVPAEANLVLCQEGVPLPRHLHVFVPIEHDFDGPAQVVGRHRDGHVQPDCARLLAAKPSAQALGLGHNLVRGDAQYVGQLLVVLCDRLRGRHAQKLVVLLRDDGRRVGLQVKVLLAADLELTLQHMVALGAEARLNVALGEDLAVVVAVEGLLLDGLLAAHRRRQVLILHHDRTRGRPGVRLRVSHHESNWLAHRSNKLGRKHLLVLERWANDVGAGHVLCTEEALHAGHAERLFCVHAQQARVWPRAWHKRGIKQV
mmetsp:Transcript_30768/g.91397  ORF Transcript_30768/g.91397 Transcript_30768/m.91397 type:complete len:297 (-) Transcript_30768:2193-3083(-)